MTKLSALGGPAPLPAPEVPSVIVRPYRSTDRSAVLRMGLSRQSLHRRFFAGVPRIPDFYAGALDAVDHWDRETLVALCGTEVVGVAEYVRDAACPAPADLAIMVADAWHRQGIARLLVGDLTDLARARGIGEFRADVLIGNAAARAAVGRLWPRAAMTPR